MSRGIQIVRDRAITSGSGGSLAQASGVPAHVVEDQPRVLAGRGLSELRIGV